MIPQNELRIGNWAIWNEDETFMRIGATSFLLNDDKFNPIPLTPEILEKAGFKKHYYENAFIIDGTVIENLEWEDESKPIVEWRISRLFHMDLFYWKSLMPDIKHLHRLQNLYFALASEELKINL